MSAVTAGGPPLPNGPTSAGAPNHTPGAIAGNARWAVAVGPAGTAGASGAPHWAGIALPPRPPLLSPPVQGAAGGGTSHARRGSPVPSGSGTGVGLRADTGRVTSCVRRASTNTTFWLTPVFVTCTVTATGWPAVRRVDREVGRLSTVIDAGVKSIVPVNDSWS